MYKAQFKSSNVHQAWSGIGTYGTESQAISAAMRKLGAGAFMVRVIDGNGSVIFSDSN